MIEALIFDLDGTLVDREIGAKKWLLSHYLKLPAPRGNFSTFYTQFQLLDERGHSSKLETFAELAQSWNWMRTPEEIWGDYRRNVGEFCELFSDATPTLCALRKKGLSLAILSNGTVECQQRKIETLGLSAMVDAILISEREGYKKPAPELFWRACEKLNKQPENCLMIGDSLKADVEGALNAGLREVFLQRDAAEPPALHAPTIHSLYDLFSFLS